MQPIQQPVQQAPAQRPQNPRPPSMSSNRNFISELKGSLFVKLIIIAIIILVLTIPLLLISALSNSRQERAQYAEDSVSNMWGGRQMIRAPILSIPIHRTITENNGRTRTEDSNFFVLPEDLKINGTITPEVRARGIYEVMLYRSDIDMEGSFLWPDLKTLRDNWKVSTDKNAQFLIALGDVKGIAKLEFKQGEQLLKNTPGAGNEMVGCPVMDSGLASGDKVSFSIKLELNGCRNLLFLPIGKTTELSLKSAWPHPSFIGGFLPIKREVGDSGFTAQWKTSEINLPFAASAYTQSINDFLPHHNELTSDHSLQSGSSLGVSLVQPTDTYHQVERTWNYSFLIIAIVLVSFLIGEQVTKIWIHPLQYFFAGLSLVMFYITLLALAEHIPFWISYLVTTVVIATITTLYCRMIFERRKAAAILLGGIMCLAYILIYVLINLEDYALLAGSGILLVLLAILMKFTGHLNREENKVKDVAKS